VQLRTRSFVVFLWADALISQNVISLFTFRFVLLSQSVSIRIWIIQKHTTLRKENS
jgi:hypothetical protein